MRGEISSGRHSKRHPLDWYVDEFWCAEQLAIALGNLALEQAEGLAIWDPCCGMGNTLLAAHDRGIVTYGSDLVENVAYGNFGGGAPLIFQSGDFFDQTTAPAPCSIICNPPYSYREGILEAFAGQFRRVDIGDADLLALPPDGVPIMHAMVARAGRRANGDRSGGG